MLHWREFAYEARSRFGWSEPEEESHLEPFREGEAAFREGQLGLLPTVRKEI
jgi:hypothetical protein